MQTVESEAKEGLGVQERILDAAEQVVVKEGVANLTLEAVAREAGMSKGGLLYHFRSKSDLIIAIIQRLGKRCETEHSRLLSANQQERGAFTRAYISARTTEPPDMKRRLIFTALLAAAGTNQDYLEPIRERARQWQTMLEADGIDPATATVIRLAIDGLCLCSLFGLPVPEGKLRSDVIEKLNAMSHNGEKGRTL